MSRLATIAAAGEGDRLVTEALAMIDTDADTDVEKWFENLTHDQERYMLAVALGRLVKIRNLIAKGI